MRKAAKLYCPTCAETRVFVIWEPPYDDPNLAQCPNCGYQPGYYVNPRAYVDPVTGDAMARIMPTIDPETMKRAVHAYQQEQADLIQQQYRMTPEVAREFMRLQQAMASEDPEERRRLLGQHQLVAPTRSR